jgi:CXXX repeat peptide maturase
MPVSVPDYALVALEDGAVPFCHYENPRFGGPSRWMEPALLRALVRDATENGIALTFLLGSRQPPAALKRVISRIPHNLVVPWPLREIYPGAMLVATAEDLDGFASLPSDWSRNLVLRAGRQDLPQLTSLFQSLAGKFGRLSLHLTGIEYFTETDLETYAGELAAISASLKKLYAEGKRLEVNVLTDRMFLKARRHCDAGEKHVTVAPDGRCFICPAFLGENAAPIGRFDSEQGYVTTAPATLAFERAPLCTRCDAWHCKRCVWLSRKLTGEYNVPSQQQCRLAHIEREASRQLLVGLGRIEPFGRLPRIVELNYDDPLELIGRDPPIFAANQSGDPML